MEDNATRAIMIGVGLFVIIIVLTGIILYVNAARNMATVVDKSLNSWDDITVSNIMDYTGDISIKCTGIDFINFLRENFMREDIYITINDEDTIQNKPISWWKNENTNNISEVKLAKIDTNSSITMKKQTTFDSDGITTTHLITVEGELYSSRDAYVTDSIWQMVKDDLGRYAYVTDGKTTLEIGDTVNYKTSKNVNGSWKVLGAANGKILLLGSATIQKFLSSYDFTDRGASLSDYNEIFSGYDDGIGAINGSARCLNFQDIERLIGYNHVSANVEYGTTYTLTWKNSSTISVNGTKQIASDGVFYWFDNNSGTFKKVEYPNELPVLTNDMYSILTNDMLHSSYQEGISLENDLTTKAADMLITYDDICLLNMSTGLYTTNAGFIYALTLLRKSEIYEKTFTVSRGNYGSAGLFYFKPVIVLEQRVKLTKEEGGKTSWSISI